MIKKQVSQEVNKENLAYFCSILDGIEYFVFFGTLLGLVRDKNLIEGDDDIDFYVPASERARLISRLADNGFSIDLKQPPNNTPFFLQVRRYIFNTEVLADFYLFERSGGEFLIDRWNYSGRSSQDNNALYVPSNLIYPIKKANFNGKCVNMPNKAVELCEFLYGSKWGERLQKGVAYRTIIWRNRPLILTGRFSLMKYKMLSLIKKLRRILKLAFST